MAEQEPKYIAYRHPSRFVVSGGPLSRPLEMGWHIIAADGTTRAVSNDHTLCERLNDLEALVLLLQRRNALYLLKRVADEGYTELTEDERELLEKMLLRTTPPSSSSE